MAQLSGIKISSSFVLNSGSPLDKKMMLTTAQRLTLTYVQRWGTNGGMIVYDTDLGVWKKLINNPVSDVTTEADWEDFGSGTTIFDISFERFIEAVFFSNLEIGKAYRFTTDLGNGTEQFTFLASSLNSTQGNYGMKIYTTIDGRVVLKYLDENDDIIIQEIPIVFVSSSLPESYVFEIGGINDNIIFR